MCNMMQKTVTELIKIAAKQLGSETKLAQAANVSQNAVWQAKRRNSISAELAKAIHWATNRRVSGHELRPDIWRQKRHVPPMERAP
jgi:DNA-binding transcriptional regulator YdaS (Cro superfamily)